MPTIAQQYEAIGEARGEAIGEARGEAIGEARGEARGKARGEISALATTLLRLISLKFGEVPEERHRQVMSAGRAQLDAWTDAVLTAGCVDDVFSKGMDG